MSAHGQLGQAGVFATNLPRVSEIAYTLLRMVVGLLLLQHGGQKLFGWFGGMDRTPGATVPLFSQLGLAGVLELLGGTALLVGLYVRTAAFLLSGLLAVAYFQAHQPHGAMPIQNHGELAVLYSFTCLFLAARGAGRFGLDGLRRPPRR
jgi:putative oxidoreductase